MLVPEPTLDYRPSVSRRLRRPGKIVHFVHVDEPRGACRRCRRSPVSLAQRDDAPSSPRNGPCCNLARPVHAEVSQSVIRISVIAAEGSASAPPPLATAYTLLAASLIRRRHTCCPRRPPTTPLGPSPRPPAPASNTSPYGDVDILGLDGSACQSAMHSSPPGEETTSSPFSRGRVRPRGCRA